MRYKQYLDKAKILLAEAEKDLAIGCNNKLVSAAWFAIETLLRAIVIQRGLPIPKIQPCCF